MESIVVPPAVEAALAAGAALLPSVSGGKDSDVMLRALVGLHGERGWPGPIHAMHADLGRAEWAQTPGHVRFVCDLLGVPLTVVKRPQGDLLDEIQARVKKLGGTAPAWPSSEARYCTSDQKRGQLDKVVRNPWPTSTMRYCTADNKRDQLGKAQRQAGEVVIVAIGLRAQEGCPTCRKAEAAGRPAGPHQHKSARAKKPSLQVNKRLTAKRLKSMSPDRALAERQGSERVVLDWLPIHEWEESDVWEGLGYSQAEVNRRRALARAGQQAEALDGWTAHPAYVMGLGNKRLSCSLCILACKSDLENGARYNPELFREYVKIEIETGFTFQPGQALADLDVARELVPDLLEGRAA